MTDLEDAKERVSRELFLAYDEALEISSLSSKAVETFEATEIREAMERVDAL